MKHFVLAALRKVFRVRNDGIDISWQDFDRRVIVGHSGRPKPGDVFTSKMQSGKMAVFEVVKVRWCGDPSNMYFADVKDVGYWVPPAPSSESAEKEEA